jgi:hypothetical protein
VEVERPLPPDAKVAGDGAPRREARGPSSPEVRP